MTRKIEYAVGAAGLFIHHLHGEGFDRGMIATFGNNYREEQSFTSTESYLHYSLRQLPNSVISAVSRKQGERTKLYDSIEDVIRSFLNNGRRDRPWLLTIITDGQDNESSRYSHYSSDSLARIGSYVLQKFNFHPTNFVFLIGVGEGSQIDKRALGTIGDSGRFLAATIAAFPLLELLFLNIAVKVSTELAGVQIDTGNFTWQQVSQIRRTHRIPIDYAFLIDRSGSMSESGG